MYIVRADLLGQHVKMNQKDPVITQLGKPTKETYRFAAEALREVSHEFDIELKVGSSGDLERFGRSSSNMYVRLSLILIHADQLIDSYMIGGAYRDVPGGFLAD